MNKIQFKNIGKALMLPMAVFPAAAILRGSGYALEHFHITSLHSLAIILQTLGNTVIDNMPCIFAIGVAYELSEDKKSLAATMGLWVFLIITFILSSANISLSQNSDFFRGHVAFGAINNQFIGILSGIIATFCYQNHHYKNNKIENNLILFISCSLCAFLCSIVLYFIWPPLFSLLISLGEKIQYMGAFGAGIYAFLNRLLIPVGMHHMINSIFWFDVIGINDIGNFWASQGQLGVCGMYQAGFYPIMMFGVPAIGLAMLNTSYIDQKKKIKPFFISAILASFLTGVTEPIEFSFMFLCFPLYILHAFLTGIIMFITATFQWTAGFSFSAGMVDFIFSYSMPLAHQPWMLIIEGIFVFVLYYYIFSFCIRKFNLHTPGREFELNDTIQISFSPQEMDEIAKKIIDACGGQDNIIKIHTCITRLHIELKNPKLFKFRNLKQTGAIAYNKVNNEIQIVYGGHVDIIMDILEKYYF